MGTEETKHDLLLKRIQVTVAILAGLATLIVGIYSIKKNMAPEPPPPAPVVVAPAAAPSPIKSALEEVGASWLQNLKAKAQDQTAEKK